MSRAPDALSIIARLVDAAKHPEHPEADPPVVAEGEKLLEWLSQRSVEALKSVVAAQAHSPGKIHAVRAEAISAAADGDEVEVLVVSRSSQGTRHQAFAVGPVAARSLIWLLKEAVAELEDRPTA